MKRSEEESSVYSEDSMINDDLDQFVRESSFWSHISQPQSSIETQKSPTISFTESHIMTVINAPLIQDHTFSSLQHNIDASVARAARIQLQTEDSCFDSIVQKALLSRVNVLATSPSFQHRMQFREAAMVSVCGFLVEQFARRAQQLQRDIQLRRIKHENKDYQKHSEQKNKAKKLLEIDDSDVDDEILKLATKIPKTLQEADEIDQKLHERAHTISRPTTLIIVPTKAHCWRLMALFIATFPGLTAETVRGFTRFEREFAPPEDIVQFEVDGVSFLPDEIPDALQPQIRSGIPLDFLQMVGGNNDDNFVVGVQLSRKALKGARIYSEPQESDVIFCSPNGILQLLKFADFEHPTPQELVGLQWLSSIFTVFMDSLDLLIEQDFQKLKQVLALLHVLPQKIDTNINLLTVPTINGCFHRRCQYVAFQDFQSELSMDLFSTVTQKQEILDFPEPNTARYRVEDLRLNFNDHGTVFIAVQNRKSLLESVKGKLQVINSLRLNIQGRRTDLIDSRIDITKFQKVDCFINEVLGNSELKTLIFCVDFFNFYRIKHFLTKLKVGATVFEEEIRVDEGKRKWKKFRRESGGISMMTEKYYYYRRPPMRAIERIIFIGAPRHAHFVAQIADQNSAKITMIIDDGDRVRLENIFGSQEVVQDLYFGKSYDF